MTARPAALSDLFYLGQTYPDWDLLNRSANRFFILNLGFVLTAIGLNHTSSGIYFQQASELIRTETNWPRQVDTEFSSSKTQIYPAERSKAKTLGRAATIIVAMEIAAQRDQIAFDVYKYLRIIPAWYFIEGLDIRALHAIEARYKASPEARSDVSLRDRIAREIDQPDGRLLDQLASGYCVTRYVADALRSAILPWEPYDSMIGPVRGAGESDRSDVLGTRNAAPSLRVIQRTREPPPPLGAEGAHDASLG